MVLPKGGSMMVSRLIIGTTISLALVLCPFLVNDTHAKSRKKSSHSAVKASRSSERSKPNILLAAIAGAAIATVIRVEAIRATAATMILNRPTAGRTAVLQQFAELQLYPALLPVGSC